VFSDGPLFDREENKLELVVLVTAIDCELVALKLLVVVSSEVRSPLLVRRVEDVCREAEL
jgi:hypothetical protein